MANLIQEVTHIRLSKNRQYFNHFKYIDKVCYVLNNDRWEPYQGSDAGLISLVQQPPVRKEVTENFVNTLIEDVNDYIPIPVLSKLVERSTKLNAAANSPTVSGASSSCSLDVMQPSCR